MKIEFSSNFLRQAKKLSGKEKAILSERIEIFKLYPSDQRLKTHALTGRLKGLFSFSLNYSRRVVFIYTGKYEALLVDVGAHEKVYR